MATDERLLAYLKRVTAELHRLREQGSQRADEAVAVVGMACRFPGGVASPEDLWRLVADGVDALSDFPEDRGWDLDSLFDPDPYHSGTTYTAQGGFLRGAGLFDAGFFRISPREALAMDPQQRLLLETSWEALEDAGIDPTSLRGSDVGVFTGLFTQGYGAGSLTPELEGFAGTGSASSVASGRVSYTFGFEGPAVTIDTACSSSLVAMHLAAQALRLGECSMALAGGATVMPTPGTFVAFSPQRVLAVDGRSKAFSASADGTGWSEGAGVVVLERLSVARERGHRILAVLRGSAINQDGASNGLTAPNGPSQQRVIRRALAGAGLVACDVDLVEAHGTGTALGDPIEAQALLATYGQGREPGRPLWLGSVKSNIGHTQAAAGVAGVIKMVQALRHGVMPATLHIDEPTPRVDWSAGAVELLTGPRDWPRPGRPRRAGVSAFGISGTNAHVILEEAPAGPEQADVATADGDPDREEIQKASLGGAIPLIVSAASPASLTAQAGRLASFLESAPAAELESAQRGLARVAAALLSDRALLAERAVVVAGSADEALSGLRALSRGDGVSHPMPGLVVGSVPRGTGGPAGKVVWVFSGQGSQRVGMGRELYDRYPMFAQALDEACRHLDACLSGWVDHPVREVLLGRLPRSAELLNQTVFTQAGLFAVESALFRLVESWGVRPDLVMGHSVGEITAAYAAGVLSLPDAARVVAARGRLMQALPPDGAMVAVAAGEQEIAGLLGADVELAAVNGPSSTVLSGRREAVLAAAGRLRDQGRRTKQLAVSHAFHSRRMEPMSAEFGAELAGVRWRSPAVPMISNVTGRPAQLADLADARYWTEHVRRPVRFAAGIAAAVDQGGTLFVELGPGAALTALVTETAAEAGVEVVSVAALRDGHGEEQTLLAAMGELFVRGLSVDWGRVLPPVTGHVDLPTYAFDHQRYWLPPGESATDARSLGQTAVDHPMANAAVRLPRAGGLVLTSRLSLRSHPWLADHAIGGTVLVAGTGLVELAVRAGDEVACPVVEELVVEAPLVVPERGGVRVQVVVGGPGENGSRTVDVYSQRDDDDPDALTRHATGILSASLPSGGPAARGSGHDFTAWPPSGAQQVDMGDFYADLAGRGYGYGPTFQGLRKVWTRGEEVFAEAAVDTGTGRFGIHPGLLDSALHAGMVGVVGTVGTVQESSSPMLPFAWNGVVLHTSGASALRVRLTSAGPDAVSLEAADETGRPVVSVASLVSRPVSGDQLKAAAPGVRDSLFHLEWVALPEPSGGPVPSWSAIASAEEASVLAGRAPEVAVLEAFGPEGDGSALALTSRVLGVVQAWLAEPGLDDACLVVVTRGAMPAGGRSVSDPAAAAVWGLVRTAQAENPDRIVLVDLDPTSGAGAESVLGPVVAWGEPQVAVRGTDFLVPRLARVTRIPESPGDIFGPGGGTVLISGAGALGALVARHLVARHGVRHLILASRRGMAADGMAELLADLTDRGAHAAAVACDVSDRGQVADLLASVPGAHPLTGVVHTAGVLDDGVINALTPDRLARVFAPKVDAVRHLDELTRGLGLAAFVVFSSASGVFGSAGQGNYAAANAFLDAAVAGRRAAGLPGVSLAWGRWDQADGMTAYLGGADQARMDRGGVLEIGAAEGMELFDAALASGAEPGPSLVLPVKLDLRADRAGRADRAERAGEGNGGAVPPLLRGLIRPVRRSARAASADDGALVRRLFGLGESERATVLMDLVRGQAATALGHAGPGDIRPDVAFTDAGIDSLTAVELRNRLRAATGLKLSATLVFDYPTPAALAGHLRAELVRAGLVEGGLAGSTAAAAATAGTGRPRAAADLDEPIAIVGMACRFPGGVADPEDLWRLVAEGREGVSPFPENRGWDLEDLFDPDPDHPGTSTASEGGFLHGAGLFDAAFFGISPREALAMDPQQRLLLETSWEALEGAGIDPGSLRGTDVGVFAGVSNQGYAAGADAIELAGYASTAGASSVVSGRVSYVFGFEGPAVTIDTACSSSLVAMHLAGQSLRQGECSVALAGGVTVMGTPGTFVEFSRQRGLAGDGRCKSYADSADGTGWAEGVGVVVLERLSVARERGHRVLAVLRGSAVNQDGASNGLTAPNGPSQQRVIRSALAGAGLSAADVDLVEGHGTGTSLGDPIEAQALLATYGRDRDPGRPLWLGSVKSNIGHAQSAAGVAGVIKVVQALRHGVMPLTLHVDAPTTRVDWSAGAVRVLTEGRQWPRNGRPRRAGVSSFGISGTNAHVIIEDAPGGDAEPSGGGRRPTGDQGVRSGDGLDGEAVPAGDGEGESEGESDGTQPAGALPLVISARGAASLAGQADRLAVLLHSGGHPLTDVAGALVSGRALFDERAVVVADSAEEASAGLGALARGEAAAGVVTGRAGSPGRLVWVFPGQGSQWAGMGRELLDTSPVFAERVAECAAALSRWIDWSLIDVLRGDAPEQLNLVDVVQPAAFAVMLGLAAVWSSAGIVPDAVVGHSQGEIAAACVAGALSLEDAARIVALRSQAIAAHLSGRGGMASVALGEQEVLARLGPWSGRVEVAAVNSPRSVVIAGDAEALAEAVAEFSGRPVAVDYASHSHHVEDIRDLLTDALAGIRAQAPAIPFFSTVTGDWIQEADVLGGDYWYRNLRGQVRFGPAMADLLAGGYGAFIEISAHPVLVQPINDLAEDGALVVGSLRRDDGGRRRLLTSMAELFVGGVAVDWHSVLPSVSRHVDLPTYAFEHSHYWLRPAAPRTDAVSLGLAGADHPMLGAVVSLPQSDGLIATSRLSLRSHPWLADHAVRGVVIVPGTGLVELAVRAGDEVGCPLLEELVIQAPLVVPGRGGVRVQVAVSGPQDDGARTVDVYSVREDAADERWTRHATGVLTPMPRGAGRAAARFGFPEWPPSGAEPVDLAGGYDLVARMGYGYGPVFRAVRALWRRGEEIFAEVCLAEDQRKDAAAFGIHPALLDAALHSTILAALLLEDSAAGEVRLPFAWNGLQLHAAGASALRVRVSRPRPEALSLEAVDEAGGLVVTLDSLVGRPVSAEQLAVATGSPRSDSLFRVDWTELPPVQVTGPEPSWVRVADAEQVATLADEVLSGASAPDVAVLEAVSPVAGRVVGAQDVPDDQDSVLILTTRVLDVVQCWLAGSGLEESRLAVVTRAAVPAGDGVVRDPAAAAVWGLVRAAQAENPDRIILVDVDHDVSNGPHSSMTDPPRPSQLGPVLRSVLATGEPQIAVRDGRLSVPRLARVSGPGHVPDARNPFRPDGTVLITGGTGSLGALLARHLVSRHGVRHLVLGSRTGLAADGAADLVAELAGQGAQVSVVACDVSERAQVEDLLAAVSAEHPLTGVVHTAGVSEAGVIGTVTPDRLARVFAPKVDAVRHLDELTRDPRMALDAFVVYSSVSSVFMGAGSGGYAAANAYLDGLMAQRRAAGLPGLSLAWGLWKQSSGMAAATDDLTRARMNRRGGLLAMLPEEGMALFDAAVGSEAALLVPAKLDLRAVGADADTAGGVPPLLRGLVRQVRQARQRAHTASAGAAQEGRQLTDRLAALPADEQLKVLLDLVRAQIAAVLGHSTAQHIDEDQGLFEIGFDSLTAVELRNRLRALTERKIAADLVFTYPTPRRLADYLRELICGPAAPSEGEH